MQTKSKKFVKRIFDFFRHFDYFGSPINFNINGDSTYKSTFGGFIFIIYVLFCLIFIWINFEPFINRKSLNLNQTTKVILPSPEITLKDAYFRLYLRNELNESYPIEFLEEYLEMKVYYVKWVGNDGPMYQEMGMRICKKEDYPDGLDYYPDLDKVYCPDYNSTLENLVIKGSWSNNEIIFLEIYLNIKKSKLDELDYIETFLTNNEMYMTLSVDAIKIDYDNYEKMTCRFSRSIFTYLDFNRVSLTDVNLSLMMTSTDNNIFMPNPIEKNLTTFYNSEPNSKSIDRRKTNNNFLKYNLANFYILSSPNVLIINRI